MKKAVILILMLLLGTIGLTNAQMLNPNLLPYVDQSAKTLDAPHNGTGGFTCYDCHSSDPSSGVPYTDALCTFCHSNPMKEGYFKGQQGAPAVLTHASDLTSTTYGSWSVKCIDCHWVQGIGEAHGQKQLHYFGPDTYLVTGMINSFADDYISTTTFYYSNPAPANGKTSWMDFNRWYSKSKNDFQKNPFSGNERGVILIPDINQPLVNFEVVYATADSITVKGSLSSAFPDNTVSPGNTFAIIYGQFIRETIYDKYGTGKFVKFFDNNGSNSFAFNENLSDYDPAPDGICQVCHTMTKYWRQDGSSAGNGVHANQNGTNCMDCHAHEIGFGSPCYQCHGNPPVESVPNSLSSGGNSGLVDQPAATNSKTAGAHYLHVKTRGYECNQCHFNSTGSSATHRDMSITIGFFLFGGDVEGGLYDGQTGVNYNATNTNPFTSVSNNGSKQCGNIYCHSSGQGSTANNAIPEYSMPQWDNPATGACGTCHKTVTGSALGRIDTGSHASHLDSSSVVKGCGDCHAGAANDGSSYNSPIHINRMIDVDHSYTAGGLPGNGYGTCLAAACHGRGTPVWSNNSRTDCTICHGDPSNLNSAPGPDTAGNTGTTNPQVGAHQTHLKALNHISSEISCSECHVVPTTVGSAGHIKDSTPGVAELKFGVLASSNLTNPAYSFSTGQCSNTYCHGGKMPKGSNNGNGTNPLWTNDTYLTGIPTLAGDCSKCHGSPPNAPPHNQTMTLAQCALCHDHFNADGILNKPSLHIDGIVQASGKCNTCHAYPPAPGDGFSYLDTPVNEGKGAHMKHILNIAAAKGVVLDPQNDKYGEGAAAVVCGACHTNQPANHFSGTRVINFGDGSTEYQFGPSQPVYNGLPGTSSNVKLKSCSNISCHFGNTPGWQDPALAGN